MARKKTIDCSIYLVVQSGYQSRYYPSSDPVIICSSLINWMQSIDPLQGNPGNTELVRFMQE